jgi:hypothetical protein
MLASPLASSARADVMMLTSSLATNAATPQGLQRGRREDRQPGAVVVEQAVVDRKDGR